LPEEVLFQSRGLTSIPDIGAEIGDDIAAQPVTIISVPV